MQYGQIITHDMSLALGTTQARKLQFSFGTLQLKCFVYLFTVPNTVQCCSATGQLFDPATVPQRCYPIIVPPEDPTQLVAQRQCMNFIRTITDRDQNCIGGLQPVEQVSRKKSSSKVYFIFKFNFIFISVLILKYHAKSNIFLLDSMIPCKQVSFFSADSSQPLSRPFHSLRQLRSRQPTTPFVSRRQIAR